MSNDSSAASLGQEVSCSSRIGAAGYTRERPLACGMSRFSSIDGQHVALRDLERQRLEKLMGQLRREVAELTASRSCR